MKTPNQYFRENLSKLKYGHSHPARSVYQDGTQATKTSIYNVFETYSKGTIPVHGFRNTAVKTAIQEMLWIYKDQTSCLERANQRGINWWDSFNVGNDTIGSAYGKVVYDLYLLDNLLRDLKENPFSNRHIMSLWDKQSNMVQSAIGGLVPCAHTTTWNVINVGDKHLINLQLTIRSSDYITAGAINRIQYYALGLMVCGHLTHSTGVVHELNEFSVLTNDLHIYDRHLFAIDELESITTTIEPVSLELVGYKDFYDYDIEDFVIKKKETYKLSKTLELAV